MLDACLSEYDESLRGTLSWPPHPCAMDITSSVPVYRPIIKKHRSSTSKVENIREKNPSNVLCGHLSMFPDKGDKRKEHTAVVA